MFVDCLVFVCYTNFHEFSSVQSLQVMLFFFQVTALCVGEHPSIIDVKLVNNGTLVDNVSYHGTSRPSR